MTPYIWSLVLLAFVAITLASRAWLSSRKELAYNVALFETGVFIWCVARIFLFYTEPLEQRFQVYRLQYLGIALIPGCAYAFARALDGRPLRGVAHLPAHAVGLLGLALAFTDEFHHWVWLEPGVSEAAGGPIAGPAYWVFLAGIYLEIGMSLAIILKLASTRRGAFGRWARTLSVVVLLPFVVNIAYHILYRSLGFTDPTPLAFAVSGIIFFIALYRFNLLDAVPYAKDVILETLDAPFVVTDPEGYVVGANEAARTAFGGEGGVDGRAFAELAPELEDFVGPGELRPFSRGGIDYLVGCYVVKRGPRHWRGRMYLFRDVTPQAKSAREREAALAQADAANAAKTAMIAVVSHELRNPLNALLGLADLDLGQDLPPSLREDLEVIRASGSQLLGLVNDLLDLSKIEAGKMELEAVDFDLHGQIAAAMRAFKPIAGKKGILLDATIAEDAPRFVRGDPLRFGQVLMNLVSNAVKFTERGAVLVDVERIPAAAGGPETAPGDPRSVMLRCSVRDTGIGIAADKLPRLFREFSQADSSVGRRYGGTGLGLSICKRLVALFGGVIEVESVEGEGSAFSFTARFEPSDRRGTEAEGGERGRPAGADLPARSLEVLIVDDDQINRSVAARYVERAGHRAEAAANGAAALALAARRRFDLVLLDLGLPDMDGFEVARRLVGGEGGEALRVAAMTASGAPSLRAACASAGMAECLAKPIDPASLQRALDRAAAESQELGPRAAATAAPPLIDAEGEGGERACHDLAAEEGPGAEAPIDKAALLARLDGDASFMRELLAIFIEEEGGRRDSIEEACGAGDLEALRRAAHGLKGSALILCAEPLAKAASALELCALESRRAPGGAAADPAAVLTELARAAAAARALLAGAGAA